MTSVVCDLDGVLYRGDTVLGGVPEALDRLRAAGTRLVFVTNNASQTQDAVAEKITRLTGYRCPTEDVLTSPMAALPMLRPEDAPILVVGQAGISRVVIDAGFSTTRSAKEANSVMVGVTPGISYQWITEAADAVRKGGRFIATNLDPTFPIANGYLPGAGAIVAAIATAAGRQPEVAGKPFQPMRDLIKSRLNGPVWVIGDRLDSDIAMASAEPEWTSILVLTGSTGPEEDLTEADHVVADLAAAVNLVLDDQRQ